LDPFADDPMAVVAFDLARRVGVFDLPLARAVRAVLESGRVEVSPREREEAEARIKAVL
jgi:hypothetical protein